MVSQHHSECVICRDGYYDQAVAHVIIVSLDYREDTCRASRLADNPVVKDGVKLFVVSTKQAESKIYCW